MVPETAPLPRLLAPAGLLLLVAVVFAGLLSGRRLDHGDLYNVFIPLRHVAERERAWPVWNPSFSNGQPLLASPFAAVLYPPNLFVAWAGLPPAAALSWLAALHCFLAALGTWLLLRNWGFSGGASWVGAVTAALGGAALSSTPYCVLQASASWMPWVVLAAERAALGIGRWPRTVLAAAVLILYLAGDPFMAAATALGVGVLVLWRAPGERLEPVLTGALGGLLLVLPHAVAALRIVSVSLRGGGLPLEISALNTPGSLEILGLALPGLLGNAGVVGAGGLWAATRPGGSYPLLLGTYAGLLTLVLATVGLARGSRRRVALGVWLGLLALLALGSHLGPAFRFLHRHLPGFDSVRYPVKWLVGMTLPLGLLTAEGVAAIESRKGPRGAFPLFALPFLLVPAAVSLSCGLASGPSFWRRVIEAGGWSAPVEMREVLDLLLLGAIRAAVPALAAVLLAMRSEGQTLARGLAVLVSVDLVWSGRTLIPTIDGSYDRAVPAVARAIQADGHPGRVYVDERPAASGLKRTLIRRTEDLTPFLRERLPGSSGASYGLDLAFDVDTEMLNPLPYMALRIGVMRWLEPERLAALSLAGVAYVVTFHEASAPELSLVTTVDAGADRPLRLYRNRAVLPRIRMASRVICTAGVDGFRAALADPAARLADVVRLDRDDPRALALCRAYGSDPRPVPRLEVLSDRHGSLEVRTTGPRGLLVVSDTLAPGLVARVDGAPAPLLQAELAFRAVPVPEGTHRVAILYEPWR